MTQEDELIVSKTEIAITNALNVEPLAQAFAQYGYTQERIATGQTLLNTVREVDAQQKQEYGEKEQATQILKDAREKASQEYVKFVKIARIALNGDVSAYSTLELTGTRKATTSGQITQSLNFYTNLLKNPTWIKAMEQFNINKELLENGLSLARQMEQAHSIQMKEMGEAQQSTRKRDQAIENLYEWYSTFIKIGRIALEHDPQLLEMIGIVAKN